MNKQERFEISFKIILLNVIQLYNCELNQKYKNLNVMNDMILNGINK